MCWINTPDQSDASHDANRYTAFGLPDVLGRQAPSASAEADCIVPFVVPTRATHRLPFFLPTLVEPLVPPLLWVDSGGSETLRELESRIHRGSYRAPPSLRATIPKPDGRQRLLGIAAPEDKVVQHVVVEVLHPKELRELVKLTQDGALPALPVATVPQREAYSALMRLKDGKVTGQLVLRSEAA